MARADVPRADGVLGALASCDSLSFCRDLVYAFGCAFGGLADGASNSKVSHGFYPWTFDDGRAGEGCYLDGSQMVQREGKS